MTRSAVPAALVVATALADAFTLHGPAFYLLVAAVPAAAIAALAALGELLDQGVSDRVAGLQVVLSALALIWIVVAAAVRSASVDDGSVPPAAASALAVCIAVFVLQVVTALAHATDRPVRQR